MTKTGSIQSPPELDPQTVDTEKSVLMADGLRQALKPPLAKGIILVDDRLSETVIFMRCYPTRACYFFLFSFSFFLLWRW